MLRLSAGGLLAAGLWPGALRVDGAAAEAFHFLVVNDTHYVDQRCGKWLERVLRRMKAHAEKIDFCLLAGDLSDHGRAEELAAVRDLFKGLGVPSHVVIGNHDYRTQDDRKAYEDLFPLSFNYSFEHRGWQVIGLDTSEGLHYQKTKVQAPTLRWLDENVPKLDRKRPTVVFTHFPMGPRVNSRPLNADDVLARFTDHNLRAVFCGHYHGFTERQAAGATLTTNRCCAVSRGNHDGTKEKGYFLCRAENGQITRTFVEVSEGW
jgi:3',5'-cyclic AMP phosphodiesterase CpdA